MTLKFNHRDCRNYAPVDVVKGICHLSKEFVQADGEQCDKFTLMPKCKHCKSFKADATTIEMGTCESSMHEPKFFAYPDMVSVTCEMFVKN